MEGYTIIGKYNFSAPSHSLSHCRGRLCRPRPGPTVGPIVSMVQLAFLTGCDDLSTCFHIYLNNQHDCCRGNVGYHNPFEFAETPKMDAMVQTGVELDRHYSYPVCTPARASIQSGRVPIHVQMDNSGPRFFNPLDTIHGYQVCSPDMAVIMHSLVFTRHSLVSVLFTF